MHVAALIQVGESVIDPAMYWRNYIVSSLNLFQACVSHGCQNVIFSSICAAYGDHDNVVLTEYCDQRPVNSYGASKRAVEEIPQQISVSSGPKYIVFLYFNVAAVDADQK